MKRVISLVPSWTETLLLAGVNVVGRSRFCIHPGEAVAKLPAVGGTKDVDWAKVNALAPDLLVLDQDENPKWMAEQAPCAWVATHVSGIKDLPKAYRDLAMAIADPKVDPYLLGGAQRWEESLGLLSTTKALDWASFPVIKWWRHPSGKETRILYLIWRNPWMCATSDTFIGSILSLLAPANVLPTSDRKYPEISLKEFDPVDTVLLFSSEPFPFAKFATELSQLGYPCALVDGELYSWFGARSLGFLERISKPQEV